MRSESTFTGFDPKETLFVAAGFVFTIVWLVLQGVTCEWWWVSQIWGDTSKQKTWNRPDRILPRAERYNNQPPDRELTNKNMLGCSASHGFLESIIWTKILPYRIHKEPQRFVQRLQVILRWIRFMRFAGPLFRMVSYFWMDFTKLHCFDIHLMLGGCLIVLQGLKLHDQGRWLLVRALRNLIIRFSTNTGFLFPL